MKKLQVNIIENSNYHAIITVLEYELLLSKHLKELVFAPASDNNRKVIVDLALKSGINHYRFVEFNLDKYGKIILNTNNYVAVNTTLENQANKLLKEFKDIVCNSILSDSQKKIILESSKAKKL